MSRHTARPVLRRRDLELYPAAVQLPSPLPPTTTTACVSFQPSQKDNNNNRSSSGVRDLERAEDKWSWDEDERPKDRTRGSAVFGDEVVFKSTSNSCSETVATMLDRLYGNDDQLDDNGVTASRPRQVDDRWWDRSTDNRNESYTDMVTEWKRHAFQLLPDSCVLNDGDQVIRVDGEDGSGTLLYDLASCR